MRRWRYCILILIVLVWLVLPVASLENGKIAFGSTRDGTSSIYIMNADGSEETRLTNNPVFDSLPAFSPDGTKIAYSHYLTGQWDVEIYVMNADGTGQTRLTNNQYWDLDPAWSPDGTKIAFFSTRDGNNEIYVMNPDGTQQTRLTNNPAVDFNPAWSPDGSKIAFASSRDGNNEVYIMNKDGTGQTRLTNNPADDRQPTWGRVPATNQIPVKVRIVPNTLNIASKGKFVAFITLPSNYKASDVDPKSVMCEGATAIRLIKSKWFPHSFAAIFSRDILVNVKPENKVLLIVTGTINKNGQKFGFSGSDVIKVISKKGTTKEAIDDAEKMTDEKVFSQFNPR